MALFMAITIIKNPSRTVIHQDKNTNTKLHKYDLFTEHAVSNSILANIKSVLMQQDTHTSVQQTGDSPFTTNRSTVRMTITSIVEKVAIFGIKEGSVDTHAIPSHMITSQPYPSCTPIF